MHCLILSSHVSKWKYKEVAPWNYLAIAPRMKCSYINNTKLFLMQRNLLLFAPEETNLNKAQVIKMLGRILWYVMGSRAISLVQTSSIHIKADKTHTTGRVKAPTGWVNDLNTSRPWHELTGYHPIVARNDFIALKPTRTSSQPVMPHFIKFWSNNISFAQQKEISMLIRLRICVKDKRDYGQKNGMQSLFPCTKDVTGRPIPAIELCIELCDKT